MIQTDMSKFSDNKRHDQLLKNNELLDAAAFYLEYSLGNAINRYVQGQKFSVKDILEGIEEMRLANDAEIYGVPVDVVRKIRFQEHK